MVEVEIRKPIYHQAMNSIEFVTIARVTADGAQLIVDPVDTFAVTDDPVINRKTGRQVERDHDPEAWTRNLAYAYRSGDLVAVTLRDDDPPSVVETSFDGEEPSIPAPAGAESDDDVYVR